MMIESLRFGSSRSSMLLTFSQDLAKLERKTHDGCLMTRARGEGGEGSVLNGFQDQYRI